MNLKNNFEKYFSKLLRNVVFRKSSENMKET